MRPTTASATLLLTIACLGLAPATTRPAKPTPASHARATLVAEPASFAPGVPFTVAVVFRLDPTWHVYFKEPGDSGMPPEVKWTLPEGFAAGELQFPKPEVLKTPAGTNFVYHDEVALLATITPAADAKPGQRVEIGAALRWLECDADVCLPAKQSATLALTAAERADSSGTDSSGTGSSGTKLFDGYRVKVAEAASFDPAAHR